MQHVAKPTGVTSADELEAVVPSDESGFRRAQTTLSDADRGSVASLPPQTKDKASLTVLNGPARGVIIPLGVSCVTIGRADEGTDVVIPEPSLSRVHARIRCARWPGGNQYFIEDAGSTNGTYVGKERITRPTPLVDGARIALGRRTFLRFGVQDSLEQEALLSVHESALNDALTGVSNRGVFDQRMQSELAFARRHRTRVSLIMLDVDHFKRFNDDHGHLAGDAALKQVARLLRQRLRADDLLCRYGGEEFAVVLRDATSAECEWLAEDLRRTLEESPLPWSERELPLTASLGLAHYDGRGEISAAELVAVADAALYRAKHLGRNRWVDAGIVAGA